MPMQPPNPNFVVCQPNLCAKYPLRTRAVAGTFIHRSAHSGQGPQDVVLLWHGALLRLFDCLYACLFDCLYACLCHVVLRCVQVVATV
jgi:hypothetical protein